MTDSSRRTWRPLAGFGAICLAVVGISSCSEDAATRDAETWGFVATLGGDTTSVERITREGDRIVGVAVGRSPRVVLRRWEATLAPDGSLRQWSMDTRIANPRPGEADLHHELAISDGVINLVRQTGSDSTRGAYADSYARTVPWNAFLYATWESLIQAARGLPDSTKIGQYFFEGWSEGNIGFARLRRIEPGLVGVTSTGLAGEGMARIDEEGRLLSYSGEGTTYRQEVVRVDDVPDLDQLFARFAAGEQTAGVSSVLSERDTLRADVGGAELIVDYSRPLARGRQLLGGLIPYDRVWRTGANAATHLTVTAPLRLGGVPLDSGTYTLWTLPGAEQVELIINAQTGQWGTGYSASRDIARVEMLVERPDTAVERFTIRMDADASRLLMEWGTFRWSVPVERHR